jgi:hypothetical protein
MIAGLSIENFTILHVAISLIGIVSGLIVLFGMLGARRLAGWTALFLATTVLTSVTGFMFPINGLTPAIVVGVISIVILAIALMALYVKHLSGAWRWIYVTTALAALYFNVFVLIVQSFQKVPALQTGTGAVRAPSGRRRGSDRVSYFRHAGRRDSAQVLGAHDRGARQTSAQRKAAVAGGFQSPAALKLVS